MNIYDGHLHTDLSFDGKEKMENYVRAAVKNGDEYFISTEHVDLKSHSNNGDDILPDFMLQQKLIKDLSKKYPINILFGTEVGYREDIAKRNASLIEKYPFDMVILSVHESDDYDVAMPEFKGERTTDEAYDEYLKLIYKAVTEFDNFDTLGHIDYVLRYIGQTDLSRHKEMLKKIFSVLIKKGKALEMNTKSVRMFSTLSYSEYIIDLYLSLGGEKFTVGSDCHQLKYFKDGIPEVCDILLSKGVKDLCFYKNRQEFRISLK
ncbi:MAG: histidinol-phosphatase HisJ family protein [Oscillospiraceae bacterium]